MYDDVLVPTDGSAASEAAVEQALAIAAPQGAIVHFLHVIDIGSEMSASGVGNIADDLTETLTDEAKQVLDAAEDADVTSERAVIQGFAHDAITEYGSEDESISS